MKVRNVLLALAALLFVNLIPMQAQTSSKKILVVYYSRSGNTQEMATQIKNATGADVFEIVPATPYPSDYTACTEQAKKEINENVKPPLKNKLPSISQYDVIFVGSPCWWSTMAPPVATFLSSYDFSGKTIVPFMTHGGSGLGRTVSDIEKLCPKATMLEGLAVSGSAVKRSNETVLGWLRRIEMVK